MREGRDEISAIVLISSRERKRRRIGEKEGTELGVAEERDRAEGGEVEAEEEETEWKRLMASDTVVIKSRSSGGEIAGNSN